MLIQAHFEHCLREIIRDYFAVLVDLSKAELDHFRTFSLDVVSECMPWLVNCELRQQSIGMIINKFGDSVKKI